MTGSTWENAGVFHLMRRVMQRHNALWRERLPDLTPVQFAVLLAVQNLPGADQKGIGFAAAVEATTMTNLLPRMERNGLVDRARDADDARRICLHLTDLGRTVLAEALPIVHAIRDECLSAISPIDRRTLRGLLGDLARSDHSANL